MARLPTIGGDTDDWGTVLNEYLTVSLGSDGKVLYRGFNVRDYGATGNGSTVDTTSVQAAIDAANSAGGGIVFFPVGTYVCNSLSLYSNVAVRGAGWGSVVKQTSSAASNTYLFQVNAADGGSSDVADNKTGISFADIQLLGRSDTDSFDQHVHLLLLSAVSDVNLRNVCFKGFRGDGIYLASGTSAATERHNERIKIIGCTFDGINKSNRNAITVIDGTDVLMAGNSFRNCTASNMPGAIDLEPNNNAFARVRDIKILHNDFVNVGGNVGVITFDLIPTQNSLTTKTRNLFIVGNTIRDCTNSVTCMYLRHRQTLDASSAPNNIVVADNHTDGLPASLYVEGIRGIRVSGNIFSNTTGAGLQLGAAYATDDLRVVDNELYKTGTTEGTAIGIYSCSKLRIQNNVFNSIGLQDGTTGRMVSFNHVSSPSSVSTEVDLIGNKVIGTTVTTISGKAASHTLTASSNACYLNDVSLNPDAAHFDKQARLTYSRTGESTAEAALRTELAAAKLLVDSTTA